MMSKGRKIGLFVALLLALSSCSPRNFPRVEYRYIHDTTRVVVRDSVSFYVRDSVFIRERGDTIYQYVERWRYRDRWRTDTIVRVRVDSVSRPVPVEIEKPLSGWRKWQIGAFWYLCGAVALLLLWTFRKSILKLIRK